jgi:aminoglycoside phosphotransferase (APT) family kinase protein
VREWAAEVVVDAELARRLLAQFPEVAADSLRQVAEGWDNTVWLVDEAWAFRFPRRPIAVPGVERELAALPLLAPILPLPIPAPVFVGRPTRDYPWPFFGSRYLIGSEPGDVELDDPARTAAGVQLAKFLRRLHEPSTAESVERSYALPADPMRRSDMTVRAPMTRARLAELERLELWRATAAVAALLAEAERLPPPEPTAVAHGDLHFRHLLLDEDGRACGVIDWGDVCRADPAIDLLLLWSFVPPSGRNAFLAAYGPVTTEQLLRARVLALFLSATLAWYAHDQGLAGVQREAIAGLERSAAD